MAGLSLLTVFALLCLAALVAAADLYKVLDSQSKARLEVPRML